MDENKICIGLADEIEETRKWLRDKQIDKDAMMLMNIRLGINIQEGREKSLSFKSGRLKK